MDYFTDLLATFLDLDRVRTLAVYGRVRELSDSNKYILICVPKMNGGLTGLKRHEDEFCMIFSEVPNFSEPNPEVLAKINQINNTHVKTEAHGSAPSVLNPGPPAGPIANGSAVFSPSHVPREISFGAGGRHLNRSHYNSGSASAVAGGGQGSKPTVTITNGRDPR